MTKTRRAGFSKKRRRGGRKTVKRRAGRRRAGRRRSSGTKGGFKPIVDPDETDQWVRWWQFAKAMI